MNPTCQHVIRDGISGKARKCRMRTGGQQYCHLHRNRHSLAIEQEGGNDGKIYSSPYMLTPSNNAPNPEQQSWYHYNAPIYQTFGDYVCIKKSYIDNMRGLVHELFSGQTEK